jgi:peptidoglycan/LPS O-acetylase OafA/YrhL
MAPSPRHDAASSIRRLLETPSVGRAGGGVHVLALDGVRGIAILLVLAFHLTVYGGMKPAGLADGIYYRIASTGWVGVDLFFVLSGFLITGILADTRDGLHYFRNFYARRALRIFPLYYGFLLLVLVVLPALFGPTLGTRSLTANQGWYWSYLSNVLYARQGWPTSDLHNYVLGHFWSLAVEEQFYLFWPPLVFLLSRSALQRVCVGLIVASFALRGAIALTVDPTAAYVLTPARMDALAIGGWIALTGREGGGLQGLRRWAGPIALMSGIAILVLFLWRGGLETNDRPVQVAGFLLLACLFGAMLVFAVTAGPASRYGALLSNPVLRFFGRYSYGLYVFHHPLILVLRQLGFSVTLFPTVLGSQLIGQAAYVSGATALAFGLAFVSWHLYESKLLKLKSFFPYASGAAISH